MPRYRIINEFRLLFVVSFSRDQKLDWLNTDNSDFTERIADVVAPRVTSSSLNPLTRRDLTECGTERRVAWVAEYLTQCADR